MSLRFLIEKWYDLVGEEDYLVEKRKQLIFEICQIDKCLYDIDCELSELDGRINQKFRSVQK